MWFSLALFLACNLCLTQAAQQHRLRSDDNANLTSPFDLKFRNKVNETLSYFHVPGISIAVVHGSEIYAQGYGLSSLPDVPATPETLYYGGSTTKAFTAAALSLLVDNDTLNWKTKVSSVLPSFVLSDEYATAHMTIEDILSHRTGLPRHDITLVTANTTISRIISNLRYLPPTAEPRTKFQYSNLMFITAGYIVESLTGTWLGDFLGTQIWKPLNMTSTYFSREDTIASEKDFAHGYFWNASIGAYTLTPWSSTDHVAGAGAVISNVVDYAKWLRSLIHRAPPLSESGHAELVRPRTVLDPAAVGLQPEVMDSDAVYSLGWWRYSYRGEAIVTHSGSVPGFGALAMFLPGMEWGVVAMANTQDTSNWVENVLVYYLLDELFGVPETERFDWIGRYVNTTNETNYFARHAKELLFPTLPDPPLPPALPLHSYTGIYESPAFPTLSLTLQNTTLSAVLPSQFIGIRAELDHVSGEHWHLTAIDLATGDDVVRSRAEFRIDVRGEVVEVGLEIDAELAAIGGKTWWQRVSS